MGANAPRFFEGPQFAPEIAQTLEYRLGRKRIGRVHSGRQPFHDSDYQAAVGAVVSYRIESEPNPK